MFFCFRRYKNYAKVTDISNENKLQKPVKRTRTHYLLRKAKKSNINVPYSTSEIVNIKIELRDATKPQISP